MNCLLCHNENLIEDSHAFLCPHCKILLNKQATYKDYSDGGGQSVPSDTKRMLRIENAHARFKLLHPYVNANTFLIDIGCGSGEMLEASKDHFSGHLGFDTNKSLIHYCKDKQLDVICDFFQQKYMPEHQQNILFSACHVLEHMDTPLEFVQKIYTNMKKDDIFYIEVPLYTGLSFKKRGYKWNLWMHEHFGLYHLDTLQYIAKTFSFNILDIGCRNFIKESKDITFLLKNFIRFPLIFIQGYLQKNNRQQLADNIFKDYGYIILQK